MEYGEMTAQALCALFVDLYGEPPERADRRWARIVVMLAEMRTELMTSLSSAVAEGLATAEEVAALLATMDEDEAKEIRELDRRLAGVTSTDVPRFSRADAVEQLRRFGKG